MAAGISIGVGSDTRDFAKGVQSGIVKPLEDVQDTFGDAAKAGDRAGEQLEAGFRDQQRATQDFATEYKQMSAQVQAASKTTSRSIQTDATDFSHKTSEGFDEIKESARSNAIEVGASFTGGFDQAAGGLQGFLAEFGAGFGPGGVIAGIVLASGLGLITNQITEGTEAAEAQKQAVADLAGEYITTGKVGRRSFDNIRSSLEKMATSNGDDVIITLQQAWEKAKKAGGDYESVVTAIASGSVPEIEAARRKLGQLTVEHQAGERAARSYGGSAAQAAAISAQAAGQLDEKLKAAEKQAKEAGRAQELAAKAGISDLQLKADLVGQVEDAYDDAATGADHFNDKTGEFEVGPFIADMKKVRAELKKYKDDLAESDLSAEAKKFLEGQGAEQAAAMLRGYQKATPKQKAQLNEIWSTSGVESAGSYEEALGSNLAKIKPKPIKIPQSIAPLVDTAALDAQLRQPKFMRVIVDAYTRDGQRLG